MTKTFIRCTFVAALLSISGAHVAIAASPPPTLIAADGMTKDGMSKDSSINQDRMMNDDLKRCAKMKKDRTMTPDDKSKCDKLKKKYRITKEEEELKKSD